MRSSMKSRSTESTSWSLPVTSSASSTRFYLRNRRESSWCIRPRRSQRLRMTGCMISISLGCRSARIPSRRTRQEAGEEACGRHEERQLPVDSGQLPEGSTSLGLSAHDPLPTDHSPKEGVVAVSENQTGIDFEILFAKHIKGARLSRRRSNCRTRIRLSNCRIGSDLKSPTTTGVPPCRVVDLRFEAYPL